MKRHFLFLLLIAFGWSVTGQTNTAVLRELDNSSTQFNMAYEKLKDFRNCINKAEQEIIPDTCSELVIDSAYQHLFRSLERAGIGLPTKATQLVADSAYFRCAKTDTLLHQLKLQTTENSLTNFLYALTVLELNNLNYEPRLFEISLYTIKMATGDTLIDTLIVRYNQNIASVGRRMGRLIQSTVLEDDDYVTPASYTRLDIAISDLKTAELHLRNALYVKPVNQYFGKTKVINNYYSTSPSEELKNKEIDAKQFLYVATDLKDLMGAGILFNYSVNFGFDVYYAFQTEGGVYIHPKIGVPVNNFHFLAGLNMVLTTGEFEYEYTGNIYYSYGKFLGGVGFSQNRIFFSIGLGGSSF